MAKLVFGPGADDARVVTFADEPLTVGRAADNHVCVEGAGIADYHLRFEREGDLAVVVDVGSESGLLVNGQSGQRFVLTHRAVVRIGDLEILYLEEATSALPMLATPVALEQVADEAAVISPEIVCPNCGTPLAPGAKTCGRCGLLQPRNQETLPAPADLYLRPVQTPQARGAGILPMLGFFLSLFGPLVLGIGWLLGIIFGFISLSLIRQRGGFRRDRRYALWSIGLGFVWLALVVVGLFYYQQYRQARRASRQVQTIIKENEADATYLLKEIAVVEEFLKDSGAIPLTNGVSAFAGLDDLGRLSNPFLPADRLQAKVDGYLLFVKAQGADGFVASAVPEHYGETGRTSFSIDQTGVLRGADLGGRPPWERQTALRELEMGRSVYLEARERIARELLATARELAEQHQFDRSRFVLRELQRKYVLTETFKNFESVAKGVEQMVTNSQAQDAADKVKPLVAAGRKAEALALYRKILADFPRAAVADDVKAQAAALEAQLAAERNQQAQARWTEIVKLDQDGKADEAIAAYRAFAGQFADTAVYQAQQGALQAAVARLEETRASALFATLTGLNVQSNATQVLQLVGQLQGAYPNAPTVKKNATMLQGLQQQAQAVAYVAEGLHLKSQENYVEAADRFDKAVALDPSLIKDLIEPLEICYFQAGETYFESNKMVEAAAAYEKFLQLSPSPEKIERTKLRQIYLSLGEINFLNKNYTNATAYLQRGAEFFGDDPKYYRMYGEALLRQKKYAEALPAFQSLVGLAKNDPQARFERALCLLGVAQGLQTNIVSAIGIAAATNIIVAAAEHAPTSWTQYLLPPSVVSPRLKDEETQIVREKQLELRLSDTLDRLKSYSSQTPEATIIREAVRLVNEIQLSGTELTSLEKDAKGDVSEKKLANARNQLLSVFATQQDFFDKFISERIRMKQGLLANLARLQDALETCAADLNAAATVDAYRGAITEMSGPLVQKLALLSEGTAQVKPSLETEIKTLEEARTLIKMAISQFKGWAIGWNLNDRIERFFQINYNEVSDRRARGEQHIADALRITVPFDKNFLQ